MTNIKDLVGKTIAAIDYPDDYSPLKINFTDGTTVVVQEEGWESNMKVKINGKYVYGGEDD